MLFVISYVIKSATGTTLSDKASVRPHNLTDSVRVQKIITVNDVKLNLFIQINRVAPAVINGHVVIVNAISTNKVDYHLVEKFIDAKNVSVTDYSPLKLPDDLGTISISITSNPNS